MIDPIFPQRSVPTCILGYYLRLARLLCSLGSCFFQYWSYACFCASYTFQKDERINLLRIWKNFLWKIQIRLNTFWQKMTPPPPTPPSPDQTCASVEAYSFILCCNIWYLGQKLRQRAEPSTSLQRLPKDQRKAHPKQELFGWTMLCHRTPNMIQTVMQSKIQLNHQIITHQVSAPFHILSNDSLNL